MMPNCIRAVFIEQANNTIRIFGAFPSNDVSRGVAYNGHRSRVQFLPSL